MLRRNVTLFSLRGIPVELNISWVLILGLITWTFANGYYPENYPGLFSPSGRWLMGFFTAILLFTSILLHEFSHSIVAVRAGLPIRRITLFMFGGVAQMEREVDDPVLEMRMAAAGPLMTLLLAIVFYGISLVADAVPAVSVLARSLADVNLGVLVFNLVPGFPLDGGRILRSVIWWRTGDLKRATRIASRIGGFFALLLMGLGLFTFAWYGSLIGGMWLIFIGFFLRQAARSGYVMVAFKESLQGLRVADFMRDDHVTVDVSTDLATLVDDFFLRHHASSFPVVRDGLLVGIVTLGDLKGVPRESWPGTTAAEIMNRSVAPSAVHRLDPAERLVGLVMRRGSDRLPVVDDRGAVIGIVTRRDVLQTIDVLSTIGE
ncbi:MAG: site-2 protease family protein [Candidatus Krumholzibacteriota bacterium]|nr:site-2 protease family protein [Candidatus Krumholzibacteriota bacterium]